MANIPDFNYKPDNAIIQAFQNAAAQKQQAEAQNKQIELNKRKQEFDMVKDTATAVGSMVSSFVQQAEKRKEAQLTEKAKALVAEGDPPPTVPAEGPMQPIIGPQLEGQTQLQERPQVVNPRIAERKKLALDLMQATDKAALAKQVGNIVFPNNQTQGRKPFEQQSNFTVTDPNTGKTRTVKAIVRSDGVYHPVTQEKVEDLSTLPDAGFKQTNKIVGRAANNQPITYNDQTNRLEINNQEYTGPVFPKLENAPSSVVEAMANYGASKDTLKQIVAAYSQEEVGPIAGRFNTVEEWAGTNSKESARFMALTRTYQNAIIKAITGAQMSEMEVSRLMGQMPTFKDNPDAFVSKLQVAAEQADIAVANRLRALEAGGYVYNDKAMSQEQASKLVTDHFGLTPNLDKNSKPTGKQQPKSSGSKTDLGAALRAILPKRQ